MGTVYRATDTALGRTVAVKVLAERYSDDESVKRRFENEALAAARLSGAPSTVTIFDVGETGERPYIVMEYLEGGSLERRLKEGRPAVSDALRWLGQAAAALDTGHAQGVVHRDVKPGNLLLDAQEEVHVADFGVASAVGLDSLTVTGMVLGTAGYLSPEQAQGQRATPASDRYALAVVAWELLTGRRPFESDSATAEAAAHVNAPVPSISPRLDPVFQRALAKIPGDRYPTAEAFVTDLRRALEPTQPVTVARPPVAQPRPNLLVPALLVAALALLGGGLAIAALVGGDDGPRTRTLVQRQTVTTPGTTITTTEPAPPPPPPSPAGKSGVQLTDEATGLLRAGRWSEAEVVARQAVAKLRGSAETYEAYAEYDLGRALAEQGKCPEALQHLNRSEQLQGHRPEIDDARSKCQ
jgi:serine/threonine protein kinase